MDDPNDRFPGRAIVHVSLDLGYGVMRNVSLPVACPFEEAFNPVDRCDDPLMVLVSSTGVGNEGYKLVMRRREDYANLLAKHISKLLVDAMSSIDTHNGYPVER